MKRLVVCCDGTWQQLTNPCPSNVVKIAQAVKSVARDGIDQIVYYSEGVGTGDGAVGKLTGGAFGWGIDQTIQKAYRFLSLNYGEGDEIYLFGFSRGAYTVRSLAGLIYCSGLPKRQHICRIPRAYEIYRDRNISPSDQVAQQFRSDYGEQVPISLLGCWDTVGALGVPDQIPILPFDNWLNAKYKFHDTLVNRRIQNAFHAVAIDERRKVFDVTRMQVSEGASTNLRQVWFPGIHGCVGGGREENRGLSDGALLWMMEETQQAGLGLEFDPTLAEGGVKPDPAIAFDPEFSGIFKLGGAIDRQLLDPDNPRATFDQHFFDNNIHLSAKQRWKLAGKQPYRPKTLVAYQRWFDEFTEPGEVAVATN
ncbi:DUF2235 domain-containing protein [Myxacorys almedinensis]|uniref:DUF2235 domain-containing protein n=1 Tax=Myxacorys almedinensis A TaxID=2690445 RepID=A0A8J7Z682_9CYAN|nr:DUF2235 domain-containing protein [Myxacorys almedinensis]NDJ18833.1 DUF2235 domain-containing protein [Myxacorys almedinensis A]